MNLVDIIRKQSNTINHPGMTPWSLGTLADSKGLFFKMCNYNAIPHSYAPDSMFPETSHER